jgi:hypothetical protein
MALSGASRETEFRECAASIVFGGRHSRRGRERRPRSFLCELGKGIERKTDNGNDYEDDVFDCEHGAQADLEDF